jgi:hypothetical protein
MTEQRQGQGGSDQDIEEARAMGRRLSGTATSEAPDDRDGRLDDRWGQAQGSSGDRHPDVEGTIGNGDPSGSTDHGR